MRDLFGRVDRLARGGRGLALLSAVFVILLCACAAALIRLDRSDADADAIADLLLPSGWIAAAWLLVAGPLRRIPSPLRLAIAVVLCACALAAAFLVPALADWRPGTLVVAVFALADALPEPWSDRIDAALARAVRALD